MNDWIIRKVRPQDVLGPPGSRENWPPKSVFTVQNLQTGEVREVTCGGAGMLDGLIADRRFDKEEVF